MGGRILVVDDDAVLRGSVAKVLEEEGYSVVEAANGEDALALIDKSRPDAILLDVMMPRMNGKRVLEALRSAESTAEIPVVLMTTVAGLDPNRTPGACDLVEKPFEVDELLDKVALALYRYRTEASPGAPPGQAGRDPGHWWGRPPSPPDRAARSAGETRATAPILQSESSGVIMLVHRDYDLSASFDERLAHDGLTTISLSNPTEDLPRLARVLEPRAMVVTPGVWTGDELAALRNVRLDPDLDAVPILVLRDDAPLPDELGEIATETVPIDRAADRVARLLRTRFAS